MRKSMILTAAASLGLAAAVATPALAQGLGVGVGVGGGANVALPNVGAATNVTLGASVTAPGAAVSADARANAQGAVNANPTAIANSAANSALGTAKATTTTAKMAGMTVLDAAGKQVGKVKKVTTDKAGEVTSLLVDTGTKVRKVDATNIAVTSETELTIEN